MTLPLALLAAATATAGAASADSVASGWHLVWSDEFDGKTIDRTKWTFDTDCWGGGNEERQCYTDRPENAAVRNGMLVITARRESRTGPAYPLAQRGDLAKASAVKTRPFTSARLTTRDLASWRYGRIAVRARLPQGQGTWPAIWMLPDEDSYGPWAASGEIDILEAVNLGEPCKACSGGRENHALGTIHFGAAAPRNSHLGATTDIPAPIDGFHVYSIDWTPASITWSIDGKPYETRRASEWHTSGSDKVGAPFDRPFHLVLNLAIGGHLPEDRDSRGVSNDGYPKRMAVDWVRVWKCSGGPASGCSFEFSGD
jgi:beta-glucanase (GH16 family)